MNAGKNGIETLRLLGGQLCLDFTNTIDPRLGNHPQDFLSDYDGLVQWSRHVGLLTDDDEAYLLREAASHPAKATIVLERAITLRETIHSVFLALTHNTAPNNTDLATLKAAFVEAMMHAQFIPDVEGFKWNWEGKKPALDQMLWPIVHSAIELLTSKDVKKVKECPGVGDCGWLFLDTSKNGSRQWCSMEGCGSRAKMRRQYARQRADQSHHTHSS